MGPQGERGEGLISGSILMLPAGVAPPPGYSLVGTTQVLVNSSTGRPPRPQRVTLHLYRRN